MRPTFRHLLLAYAVVIGAVYLNHGAGPAASTGLALAVGWYFGYLHGVGVLRG